MMPRMARPFLGRLLGIGLLISGLSACSYGGAPEGSGRNLDLGRRPSDSAQAFDASAPPDLRPVVEPDWTRLTAYLDSLFNEKKSLVREFPGATTYVTANDNTLAARAYQYLPVPNLARKDAILSALRAIRICGCGDIFEHDATLNHYIDPVVTRAAVIPVVPRSGCGRSPEYVGGPTASCGNLSASCAGNDVKHADYAISGWAGDNCNFLKCYTNQLTGWDAVGLGRGYADLLALEILSYKNRGMATNAMWENLVGKWDGMGLYDQSAAENGNYETWTLALFKIAARVINKPLPTGVDEKLKEAQGSNGGIRVNYAKSGSFALDDKGNAATTALVVLAFLKPVADF